MTTVHSTPHSTVPDQAAGLQNVREVKSAALVPSRKVGFARHPAAIWGLIVFALAILVTTVPDFAGRMTELAEVAVASAPTRWTILLIYIAVLTVPFLPSSEIGLALMLVYGSAMALPVYIATILALSIAFGVGRFLSLRSGHRLVAGQATFAEGVSALAAKLPAGPALRQIMNHRWLTAAILFNTPGNTVVGGGGGIAMAMGCSRSFTFPAFLICVALAVAPVPIMVLLAGYLEFGAAVELWLHGLVGNTHLPTTQK